MGYVATTAMDCVRAILHTDYITIARVWQLESLDVCPDRTVPLAGHFGSGVRVVGNWAWLHAIPSSAIIASQFSSSGSTRVRG